MSAHVASRHHHTIPHPHQQLAAGTSAMRAASGYRSHANASGGDLAILSAETYVDPGLSFLPSPPGGSSSNNPKKNKKENASPSTSSNNNSQTEGTVSPSKKRLKRNSPEEGGDREGEEEEKKRSRGRPRLDIKDETAADRRRTQIRLAQRAYRNRKENAIQMLERQVQELRNTNEEMSNAFMRLHDFAVNNGLVDQAPEFGRQLRSTTEKFLTLARLSSEETGKLDEGEGKQQNSDAESSSPEVSNTQEQQQQQQQPQPAVMTPPPDTSSMSSILAAKGSQPYGGFIVTHEPVIEDLFDSTTFSTSPNNTATIASSMPEYEIITQPTLDNASFPFPFDFSASSPTPNNPNLLLGLSSAAGEFNAFNNYSGSLFPTLSAPASYAAQEATFGRRLQRTGAERALVLITMPNPPVKLFNRVFGFCLMIESKEAIYKRLMRVIQKTTHESLNNWNFPFFNLGGAGTQLPTSSSSTPGNEHTHRMGNSGTIDVMKPMVTSGGYNMGPFGARVSEVSHKFLDKDMRVNPTSAAPFLTADGTQEVGIGGGAGVGAGFLGGGEYFDCDEVEFYLHQRGVVIPPAADFITAEVETQHFENGDGSTGTSTNENGSGNGNGNSSSGVSSPLSGDSSASWGMMDLGGIGVDPMLQFTGVDGNVGNTANGSGRGGNSTKQTNITGTKKMVTVDINLLVYELTERTVCLGRTPGIKQEDINVAFWKASQVLA